MALVEICGWFEACEREAIGMAAHPIQGVIPVCKYHVTTYSIPLITHDQKHDQKEN